MLVRLFSKKNNEEVISIPVDFIRRKWNAPENRYKLLGRPDENMDVISFQRLRQESGYLRLERTDESYRSSVEDDVAVCEKGLDVQEAESRKEISQRVHPHAVAAARQTGDKSYVLLHTVT